MSIFSIVWVRRNAPNYLAACAFALKKYGSEDGRRAARPGVGI